MSSSEGDIFRIYASPHGKAQKRPGDYVAQASPAAKATPPISKNARNAPNFDYLDPGHINPHPAYKSPKFGLKRGKDGKCHVTSYPECSTKTLYQAKNTQNTAKKQGAPLKKTPP